MPFSLFNSRSLPIPNLLLTSFLIALILLAALIAFGIWCGVKIERGKYQGNDDEPRQLSPLPLRQQLEQALIAMKSDPAFARRSVITQRTILRAAQAALKLGRPKEALTLAQRILDSPLHSALRDAARLITATVATEQNRFDVAIATLRELADAQSERSGLNDIAALKLALLEGRMGHFAAADELLARPRAPSPINDHLACAIRSALASLQGDNLKALEWIDDHSSIPLPSNRPPNLVLETLRAATKASILNLLGRWEEGLPLLEGAAKKVEADHKGHSVVRAIEACTFACAGRTEESQLAIADVERRLSNFSDDLQAQHEILRLLGRAADSLRNFDRAAAFYRRALASTVGPAELARLYFFLAQSFQSANRSQEAAEAFRAGAATNFDSTYCRQCQQPSDPPNPISS